MKILLLDFEATDKEPKTARITEIGAMLVDENFQRIGDEGMSELVYDETYPAQSQEVIKITGITDDMLKKNGIDPVDAFTQLGNLSLGCDYIMAYNRNYDEVLFKEEAIRTLASMTLGVNWMISTPWLCAMADVEANHKLKTWKLMYVALEHGVAVDPKKLHRAINDVELTREMLVAAKACPKAMYEFQTSPWIYAVAKVKAPWEDNGRSTGAAKELGFSWQQAKGDDSGRTFEKRWVKRLKQKDFEGLKLEALTFQVAQL